MKVLIFYKFSTFLNGVHLDFVVCLLPRAPEEDVRVQGQISTSSEPGSSRESFQTGVRSLRAVSRTFRGCSSELSIRGIFTGGEQSIRLCQLADFLEGVGSQGW